MRSSLVGRSSVMFRASLTKNPYLKKEKRIKIFYFGNPISKVLSYSNQTTVAELIDRAIFAYLEDPGLDKHRIRTTNTQGIDPVTKHTSCGCLTTTPGSRPTWNWNRLIGIDSSSKWGLIRW